MWHSNLHLPQILRRPKNPGCLGCATHNLPPLHRQCSKSVVMYPSQAALGAYSGTGGDTPPGHTQILRLRNL